MFRRYWAPIVLGLFDAIVVSAAPFLALLIRFEGEPNPYYFKLLLPYLPIIVGVRLSSFFLFRLYHRVWRYAGVNELLAIVGSTTVGSVILTALMVVDESGIPRSIHLLSWAIIIAFVGFSRVMARIYYHFRMKMKNPEKNILIVGAGDAGAMLAREIINHCSRERRIVGFVDDDFAKHGQQLMGIPVLGGRVELPRLALSMNASEILIAIPSAPGSVIREITNACRTTTCSVRILPNLTDLIDGKVSLQNLRPVDLEDLLRRDPIRLDMSDIEGYLKGKRVMVTGAGGSIGSELCRQIAGFSPEKLLILGKGENSIYEIDQELQKDYPKLDLLPIIADVRDAQRMEQVFETERPQVVFHAAAHKHVPLMECYPVEAVKNNVLGTKVLAETADRHNVETFILISTDKAVNPSSVMGASKRIAELILQQMSQSSKTRFSAVRFGNVLGSRGSVVPLFRKQIATGGPITVTDPEMKRYFMSIPEASQLVLQAGSMACGGEVFVLDMGEPIRIVDLAEDLIRLSGYEPYRDVEIVFSQIRPGEKLFEELMTAEEGTRATCHEKIYIANLRHVDAIWLDTRLGKLITAQEPHHIKELIAELVPTYKSTH